MAFVETISYQEASEKIKRGYDAILRHSLRVPNLHAASGIRPDIMETLATHVRTVMSGSSGLTTAEKEMIATVVSSLSKCQYSTAEHALALRAQESESQLSQQLGENYREGGLSEKQVAMLEFAESLTTMPSSISRGHVDNLRELSWSDEDIVEIVHVTGTVNYLSRVVDGLGVELPPNRGYEEITRQLSFRDEIVLKPFGDLA